MDFSQVIYAHSAWKNRLKDHIMKNEPLDAATIAKDDQCELGKWIYGEGRKYSSRSEYADVKQKHARFHAVTAEVVRKAAALKKEEALQLIGQGTDFARASSECVAAIAALRDSLNAQ